MSTYAIKADAFYLPTRVARGGYLMVEDGVFGEHVTEAPDCEVLDYSGHEIAPGFVDTHIHGFDNHDIMDCKAESVAAVSRGILRNGVTSYLPPRSPRAPSSLRAPAPASPSTSRRATMRRTPASRASSSRPLLYREVQGCPEPRVPVRADHGEAQQVAGRRPWLVKKIAVAPEYEGAVQFTADAVKSGVVVALGHSAATCDQAQACSMPAPRSSSTPITV